MRYVRLIHGNCDVRWRLEIVLYALEILEDMHCVLLCMLEASEGDLSSMKELDLDLPHLIHELVRHRLSTLNSCGG